MEPSERITDTANQQGSSANRRRTSFAKLVAKTPLIVIIALVMLVLIPAVGVFAPKLAPYPPTKQSLVNRLAPPDYSFAEGKHFLGTDHLGRDLLSRTLYAIRTSLGLAALGMGLSLILGMTLGLLSGMVGGVIDDVVMFLVDLQLAVPMILIALIFVAVFGTSLKVLIFVLGIARWESYARMARGQILLVKEQPFAEAASSLGASSLRIATKHILPNIASPIIVLASANLASVILLESSLSFLGVGVQPPDVSLGLLISGGRDYLFSAWWMSVFPSIVLVLLTVCISLGGDWLRDVLDPRLNDR